MIATQTVRICRHAGTAQDTARAVAKAVTELLAVRGLNRQNNPLAVRVCLADEKNNCDNRFGDTIAFDVALYAEGDLLPKDP